MYEFPEGGGKPDKHTIPEEEKEKADKLHNELVEKAAENDDELMSLVDEFITEHETGVATFWRAF